MKIGAWLVAIGCAVVLGSPLGAQSLDAALQQAIQKEVVTGDCKAAIADYDAVSARAASTNRGVAAEALLRAAMCHEKIGDGQAQKLYAHIANDFKDQRQSADEAMKRLVAIGPVPSGALPRMICEQCGDVEGSVSTDGRFMTTAGLAFDGDIAIRDLSTGSLERLHIEAANQSGAARFPLPSSDGTQIAYTWEPWSANRAPELRVVARDDPAHARVLLSNPQFRYVEPAAWGPGGSLLVGVQHFDNTWEIGKVSLTGVFTTVKNLGWRLPDGPFHAMDLSPDGRYVVYEARPGNPTPLVSDAATAAVDLQIYVVDTNGSAEVALTAGAESSRYPVWTPDGRHVLFISNLKGASSLWAIPIQERPVKGAPVSLKVNIGHDVRPLGISKSGTYFFYEENKGVRLTSVATVTSGGAQAAEVSDRFMGTHPTWSPDGKAIAITRALDGESPDIVVRQIDGGQEQIYRHSGLTPAQVPNVWFPNSRDLLVMAREANRDAWYRLGLDGGEFRKLADAQGNGGFQSGPHVKSLDPDGRTIYFGTLVGGSNSHLNRTALDIVSAAYRTMASLPIGSESIPQRARDVALAIDPTGTALAMAYVDAKLGLTHVVVVGTNGQGYRELCPPVQATDWLRDMLVWSHDGRWLYLATTVGKEAAADDVFRVMRVPFGGGVLEYTGVEAKGLDTFDVSPDGARIAFSANPEGREQLVWAFDVNRLLNRPPV